MLAVYRIRKRFFYAPNEKNKKIKQAVACLIFCSFYRQLGIVLAAHPKAR